MNQSAAAAVARAGLSSVAITLTGKFPAALVRILFFFVDPALSAATPMAGGALGFAHIA